MRTLVSIFGNWNITDKMLSFLVCFIFVSVFQIKQRCLINEEKKSRRKSVSLVQFGIKMSLKSKTTIYVKNRRFLSFHDFVSEHF